MINEIVTQKICTKCKDLKVLDLFYPDARAKDGRQSCCANCYRLLNKKNAKTIAKKSLLKSRTEQGAINTIYYGQRGSSRARNHPMPLYTKQELSDWLYKNGFYAMWCQWVWSDFDRWIKPSCDRLNDYKGYSFGNIRLVRMQQNQDKADKQTKNGVGTKGAQCVPVKKISLDGMQSKIYISLAEASRDTGNGSPNIHKCLNGTTKTCGGYKWEYA